MVYEYDMLVSLAELQEAGRQGWRLVGIDFGLDYSDGMDGYSESPQLESCYIVERVIEDAPEGAAQ